MVWIKYYSSLLYIYFIPLHYVPRTYQFLPQHSSLWLLRREATKNELIFRKNMQQWGYSAQRMPIRGEHRRKERRKSIVMIMIMGKVCFFRTQCEVEWVSPFLPFSAFQRPRNKKKWLQLILLELFQFQNLLRIAFCCCQVLFVLAICDK